MRKQFLMRKQFFIGLVLLLAIPVLADQIVLKNGDRLTGTITKSTENHW